MPVGAHIAGVFVKRRLESGQLREVGRIDADSRVLFSLFVIAEPEEPILYCRPAQAEAVLLPVELRLGCREVRSRCVSRATAVDESAPVQGVASSFGDNVDRARAADAGGGIGRGGRDLEFLDALLREVDGCCP